MENLTYQDATSCENHLSMILWKHNRRKDLGKVSWIHREKELIIRSHQTNSIEPFYIVIVENYL